LVTSQELSWGVRAELFGQIGAMLSPIVEALDEADTKIDANPTDFDISFSHEDLDFISA